LRYLCLRACSSPIVLFLVELTLELTCSLFQLPLLIPELSVKNPEKGIFHRKNQLKVQKNSNLGKQFLPMSEGWFRMMNYGDNEQEGDVD
jgi:hypothetical protein